MFSLLKKSWRQLKKPPTEPPTTPQTNYYYYEQYGLQHLIKLEHEAEQLHIYSLSDEEYIETIHFEEVIGCTMVNQPDQTTVILHRCPQEGRQPRRYQELIFKSVKGEFQVPSWYYQLKQQIKSYRLLVIINPCGGSQNGLLEYDSRIQKIFSVANCRCETYLTKCAGDATQYLSEVDLHSFDQIVVFGGDGTVSEVIHGLLQHPDPELALQKPVRIIPTGSGNGLVRSILHENQEPFSILGATYRVLRTPPIQIPLIKNEYRNPEGQWIEKYSFLATAWGLPSDVDLESEFYRFLGSVRFTLGTIVRLINLRSYRGVLKFLPAEDANRSSLQQFEQTHQMDHRWETLASIPEHEFVIFWACNAPYVAEDMLVAPSMTLATRQMSLVILRHPLSRYELLSLFWNLEQGEHIHHEKIINHYVYAFHLTPDPEAPGTITLDGEQIEAQELSSMISSQSFWA